MGIVDLMKKFAVWLLACLTPLASMAQTFWHGTTYGDTVEQVSAKVADLRAVDAGPELRAKGFVAIASAPTLVVGQPMEALFYFRANGLYQLVIRARKTFSESEAAATEAALIGALRKRYGRQRSSADELIRGVPEWLKWENGETDVFFAPQRGTERMGLIYKMSERQAERDAAKRVERYKKSIDIGVEAGKL